MSGILKAMHAVMSEVGAIEKARTNPQQGYKFRGIDEVLEALQPLFVKRGVICTQEVLHHEREMLATKSGGTMVSVRLKVLHTYRAVSDDSFVTATTWGEAMDAGDKASNKAMAAALKYAHCFSFTIPTRDPELDTETASPETRHGARAKPAATARPAAPTVFPNYGPKKGAPIAGADAETINYYRRNSAKNLTDTTKVKWHETEKALIAAYDAELARAGHGLETF
jgi:hypothetical protein